MSRKTTSQAEHVIGTVGDFPVGSHRVVEVAGRAIGVFNVKGEMFALPNICPHQTGPVCAGRIVTGSLRATQESGWKREWVHDGEVIVCPWHGLEYHVPTGQCLAHPHIRLRHYPVSVQGDDVVLRLATRPRAAE